MMIPSLTETGRRRSLGPAMRKTVVLLSAAFSLWVSYANLFVISDPLILGILFISGIFTILFLAIGATSRAPDDIPFYDWVLSALSLACGVYFFMSTDAIAERISLLDTFTPDQLFFGSSLLFLTLEVTRRTTGLGLTGVVMLFLIYNLFGYLLPPPFGHRVSEFSYLLDILVFTTDVLFGVPILVVAIYVFLFVIVVT